MTAPIALSVVVPAVNTLADVERTLTALAREGAGNTIEVLLVDRTGQELRDAVRMRFPDVRVLDVPESTSIPAMRLAAFSAARGRYVAVIEDHVTVPKGWASSMIAAAERANDESTAGAIVGGSVANAATTRLVDWAAFLCEYSHCLPPLPAGPSTWLPGNNVIYPRALLEAYRERLRPDQWENALHDMLRGDGVVLMLRPDITVGHEKYYSVREYVTQRYLYARSFAGARLSGAPVSRRMLYGALAFALPPVLLGRIIARVMSKRRHRTELLKSVPLLVLFVCAWACGEVIGYVFGAGDSLSKVC